MRLSVICNDIRSIHNVGSIFRTADAAGVDKIYLCGVTPNPRDRFGKIRADFAKVSLGAENSVEFESVSSGEEVIKSLKADGWHIFALEQSDHSIAYDEVPVGDTDHEKCCILLGAEVDGLSAPLLALADRIIEIPMRGSLVRNPNHPRSTGHGKESLNVSVAFGIAIFELVRRSRKMV
jgi:tRNA G18 (ribose-2'-O)-methylase SpoU